MGSIFGEVRVSRGWTGLLKYTRSNMDKVYVPLEGKTWDCYMAWYSYHSRGADRMDAGRVYWVVRIRPDNHIAEF